MSKPRSIPLDYPRRRFGEAVWGPARSGALSLRGGVVRAFPGLSEARLAGWVREVQQTPGVEVEAEELLFAMLLCGVRLGVYGPDLAAVKGELWAWLTWAPRHMPAHLADLVVEALTPGLARAVERRGSKVGPSGTSGLKGGRPPLGSAAWAAATVVDRRLRSPAGEPHRVRQLTLALAALLLGRPSSPPMSSTGSGSAVEPPRWNGSRSSLSSSTSGGCCTTVCVKPTMRHRATSAPIGRGDGSIEPSTGS